VLRPAERRRWLDITKASNANFKASVKPLKTILLFSDVGEVSVEIVVSCMSVAATTGDVFRAAPKWAPRKFSFSPFDPNTPHLRFAVVSILVLWLIVLSAISFLPRQYASRSTLIIPGATPAVSVSLDRIGQTSSAPSQAYNTVALSPKVIYKEMLLSDEVRQAAAYALGMSLSEFGAPRIKLIDETALINIEFRGREPEEVYRRLVALVAALQKRLERLRSDELDQRSAAVKQNLKFYEDNLADARQKISALQSRTGLHNEIQFNELGATLVRRNQRFAEMRGDLERIERERATIAARVGVDAETAAIALKMVADPTLVRWLTEYADAQTAWQAEARRLGSENPFLLQFRRKADVLRESLADASRRFGVTDPKMIEVLMLVTTMSQQADLMKQLVVLDGLVTGKRAEVEQTGKDLAVLDADQKRFAVAAAELEDLKKSQLVAEAVFSTAMARINTTRSDIYGSYPLVQTLAAPSLPNAAIGSQGLYGIAGGILGTLLLALGWFLAWLRTGSGPKTLKSA
jgi:uncharacterized protein involved in exopolysaccharide biosynthesis